MVGLCAQVRCGEQLCRCGMRMALGVIQAVSVCPLLTLGVYA